MIEATWTDAAVELEILRWETGEATLADLLQMVLIDMYPGRMRASLQVDKDMGEEREEGGPAKRESEVENRPAEREEALKDAGW
jgi:hypothetical protein